METKVKDLVQSAISKVRELSDADTIIGKPIKVDDSITIIPVSKVSYGFAAGGSDLPSKSNNELFGGGSGAGVTIQPIAFLVIGNGDVQLMQISSDSSAAGAIVNLVPDLISKVQSLFTKKKDDPKSEIPNPLGDTSDFDF
ncbi:MAG: GerW family sporulation protein [Oscillospiraceae bacterium]|nr:GerW family sporulation protein [Oscillospiraceae bacterium]